MEQLALVGLGGAIGAVARYSVAKLITEDQFPIATLLVNVVGSFILGLVLFFGADEPLVLFIGVGICGAFTTFSTFSFETVRMLELGQHRRAIIYSGSSLIFCLLAILLSWIIVILIPV